MPVQRRNSRACTSHLPPPPHTLHRCSPPLAPHLRPARADTTRALYEQDVVAIEATVLALEHKLRDIKAYVQREAAAIPQVEAVVAACQLQQQHLTHIAGHLPTYLPSLHSPEVGGPGGGGLKENSSRPAPNQAAADAAGGGGVPKKQRPPAPRRYISAAELASASSYMRGRLTADRINAALDEMAALAEANATMVAAARRNRAVGPDKKHAMWVAFNIAVSELGGRRMGRTCISWCWAGI